MIRSLSYKDGAKAVEWSCDGSPEYEMKETEKAGRRTDIILYIDEDSKEFLEQQRIDALLKKYCRFLPVPVISGKEQEWKDGKIPGQRQRQGYKRHRAALDKEAF